MELDKCKISIIDGAKIYAQLKKDIEESGILERAYFYYFILTIITFSVFLLSLYFIYTSSSYLVLFVSAVTLVFASVQFGGILHDAGHRAIFKSAIANDVIGQIAGSIIVMGFGRWKDRHNKHHASPNIVDEDPDLEMPFHTFNKSKFLEKKGIEGAFKKYQAYIFYPIRSLFIVSRRIEAYKDCFNGNLAQKIIKLSVFTIGIGFWFILPVYLLGWAKGLFMLLIVNVLSGLYFPSIFAPNHKGMPQYKKGANVSFLEQQIVTSRNVKPGFLQDNLLVGLNFQIEHHLFTACPRNKLKLITPYVKEICRRTGINYTETGFIQSNIIIVKELNRIAKFA